MSFPLFLLYFYTKEIFLSCDGRSKCGFGSLIFLSHFMFVWSFFALKFVVASELILCFSIFFFGVKPCATSMIQDFKCIHHYPYINRILSLYTHDVSL